MKNHEEKTLAESFLKLVEVVAKLRTPGSGCPWDLEQTHESLKPFMIEETYEALSAIDHARDALQFELGDVLLQVLLHAQIASEENTFTLREVLDHLSTKLIYRHPHVFGDTEAKTAAEVLSNWERLKQMQLEKGQSVLDGVPADMPALLRSQRIGEKAARVGFEWRHLDQIRDKVLEEVQEFIECSREVPDEAATEDVKEEFGDILFALTQLARRLKLNSEEILHRSTDKFIRRFKEMERRAVKVLHECSLEELDSIWEQIKEEERGRNAAQSQ